MIPRIGRHKQNNHSDKDKVLQTLIKNGSMKLRHRAFQKFILIVQSKTHCVIPADFDACVLTSSQLTSNIQIYK